MSENDVDKDKQRKLKQQKKEAAAAVWKWKMVIKDVLKVAPGMQLSIKDTCKAVINT